MPKFPLLPISVFFVVLSIPMCVPAQTSANAQFAPATAPVAGTTAGNGSVGLQGALAANILPASPFAAYLPAIPKQTLDSTAPPPPPKPKQVGSISFGYDYLRSDLTAKQAPTADLMGWHVTPQYDVNKHLGLFVDFTNFYPTRGANYENVHGFTGGPSFVLPIGKKFSPFVFVEGGSSRVSAMSKISWYTTVLGGFGANFNFSHNVSLQVIPFEYVATRQKGEWVSNMQAQVNLVLNIYNKP